MYKISQGKDYSQYLIEGKLEFIRSPTSIP